MSGEWAASRGNIWLVIIRPDRLPPRAATDPRPESLATCRQECRRYAVTPAFQSAGSETFVSRVPRLARLGRPGRWSRRLWDCGEHRRFGFKRSVGHSRTRLRRGARAAILAAVPKPAASLARHDPPGWTATSHRTPGWVGRGGEGRPTGERHLGGAGGCGRAFLRSSRAAVPRVSKAQALGSGTGAP